MSYKSGDDKSNILSNIVFKYGVNRETTLFNKSNLDNKKRENEDINKSLNDSCEMSQGSSIIVNTLIASTVQQRLERNINDAQFMNACGFKLQVKLKQAFENLIKSQQIEDYDQTQNFRRIKQNHSMEYRFTDTEFRACEKSVFHSNVFKEWLKRQNKLDFKDEVIWKRAKNLVKNARFVIDDDNVNESIKFTRINESNYKKYFRTTDLDQGALGNCWFISAATGIIQNYSLFKKVVPFDNTFDDKYYTGI